MAVDMRRETDSGQFRVGVQHRLFHLTLREWRQQRGISQKQLAQMAGFSPQRITTLEAFRAFPTEQERERLAEVTGIDAARLFPAWLREWVTGEAKVVTTEHEITPAMLTTREHLALAARSDDLEVVECEADRELLAGAVAPVLETLGPRERAVIEERYGIGTDEPKTYGEIGATEGVTHERIRQIEAKALRKLRHPERSGRLRPFVGNDDRARAARPEPSTLDRWIETRGCADVGDPYVTHLCAMIAESKCCRSWSVLGLRDHLADRHSLDQRSGFHEVYARLADEFKAALRSGGGA